LEEKDKMKTLRLQNTFHHTDTKIQLRPFVEYADLWAISAMEIDKIRIRLCGLKDCKCSEGIFHENGYQDWGYDLWSIIEETGDIILAIGNKP
jgi:hypothetical protein